MKQVRLSGGLTFLLAIALSGCSLFDDHAEDYLQAEQVDDIVLPADMQKVAIKERLVVPVAAQPENLSEEYEAPRPEPLNVTRMKKDQSEEDKQSWASQVNARLVTDGNGSPILRLDVEFPQAWSQVGMALRAKKISIEDLDRSVGTYYVILKDAPEKESSEGWFSDDKKPLYEVKVNRARSGVYVALHQDADNLADNEYARGFLESLKPAIENPQEKRK